MTPAEAFVRHHADLLRLAGHWYGHGENAEEATSLMWVRAIASWHTWDGRASRKTWLGIILRSEWLNEVRRRKAIKREGTTVAIDEYIERTVGYPARFDTELIQRDELTKTLARLRGSDRDVLIAWAYRDGSEDRMKSAEKTNLFRAKHRAREIVRAA